MPLHHVKYHTNFILSLPLRLRKGLRESELREKREVVGRGEGKKEKWREKLHYISKDNLQQNNGRCMLKDQPCVEQTFKSV